MKKILIILALTMLSMTSAHAAGNKAGTNMALRHANPMPNLMRIAMGNAELLEISKEQMKSLRAWSSENKPKMMAMVKDVMMQERALHEEALTTDKDVMSKAEKMLQTRKKIIEMKTACRAELKKILSEKQYAEVIGIYRSVMPKK